MYRVWIDRQPVPVQGGGAHARISGPRRGCGGGMAGGGGGVLLSPGEGPPDHGSPGHGGLSFGEGRHSYLMSPPKEVICLLLFRLLRVVPINCI